MQNERKARSLSLSLHIQVAVLHSTTSSLCTTFLLTSGFYELCRVNNAFSECLIHKRVVDHCKDAALAHRKG